MTDHWDSWFHLTCQVRRLQSQIANLDETFEYEVLYEALPTFVLGENSESQDTILGQLGFANFKLVWRLKDIDEEKGWPDHGDVVVLNGLEYFVIKLADHTNMPPMFDGLPKHKIVYINQDLVDMP